MSHFYEITQEALGVDYTSAVTEGVWDSIKSTISSIWEKVKSFFRWIIDKFKSLFGLDKSDKKEKATPKRYTEATFTIEKFIPFDKLQSFGEKFIASIKKSNKDTLKIIDLTTFNKTMNDKEDSVPVDNDPLRDMKDEIKRAEITYKVTISESKKKEIENLAKKYEEFVKRIEKEMEDDVKTTEQIANKGEKHHIQIGDRKLDLTKMVRLSAFCYTSMLKCISNSGLALVKICKWFEGSQKAEDLDINIEFVSGKN